MTEADREQARSFDRVAAAYQQARPSYPAAAVERREFGNPVPFDRARLGEWASTTSRIAVLPGPERERVLADVVRLADEHPDLAGRQSFDMPFVAVAVRARRS